MYLKVGVGLKPIGVLFEGISLENIVLFAQSQFAS